MSDDDENVISFEGEKDKLPKKKMIEDNGRRFSQDKCQHDGGVIVRGKEASVECKDCGTLLNPIYVLQLLAAKESYYQEHVAGIRKHLNELNKEIEGRTRTKCTHCGNMTAIKFKDTRPRTWMDKPNY